MRLGASVYLIFVRLLLEVQKIPGLCSRRFSRLFQVSSLFWEVSFYARLPCRVNKFTALKDYDVILSMNR